MIRPLKFPHRGRQGRAGVGSCRIGVAWRPRQQPKGVRQTTFVLRRMFKAMFSRICARSGYSLHSATAGDQADDLIPLLLFWQCAEADVTHWFFPGVKQSAREMECAAGVDSLRVSD